MSDTPPVPPATDPPKPDPSPAPAPPPPPTTASSGNADHDGLVGRISQAMDQRFDRLAGRLETALRPPTPPEPDRIEAPEPTPTPEPATPAGPEGGAKRKHWYFG